MNLIATPTSQRIFPGLRYVDAVAAIDWLERAFGFQRQFVVPGPDGSIAHAQLVCHGGMIMLGSYREDSFGYKTPQSAGGVTQSAYVYIADIVTHFETAKNAGAEIVLELKDTDYGSREYSAKDLEGHLWHFGTFLPEIKAGA